MIDNSDKWLAEAKALVARASTAGDVSYSQSVQFATSMLAAVYGAESPQLRQFREGCAVLAKVKEANHRTFQYSLGPHALNTIRATIAEMEAGLILRLRVALSGEILVELIGLAKEVLQEQSDAAKNTASVLVAAAFESLLRRMGEEFAGITTRPKLEDVISTLKEKGILKGGEVGTAISYLKFRNDSLHADWQKVSRPQVESCLAFTESMLVKHFS